MMTEDRGKPLGYPMAQIPVTIIYEVLCVCTYILLSICCYTGNGFLHFITILLLFFFFSTEYRSPYNIY